MPGNLHEATNSLAYILFSRQLGWLDFIAFAQAAYFAVTGIWPLVSIRTFIAVTAPKTDIFLVNTVGLLVTAIAIALVSAVLRNTISFEMLLRAVSSSLFLTSIDVYYAAKGVIWKTYLLDSVAESLLIAGWLVGWLTSTHS